MATNHGTFGEFKEDQEPWQSYVERLQQHFVATDVRTQEKQRALLLSAVGAKTYQLIRNLLAPAKPTDKTFAEIVETVKNHHQPLPSEIVQRFNFHSRARQTGEDVSTYIAELRKLSEHCNFSDTLKNMLRDRLVCDINDHRVQRRLLAEPTLTLEKALELAQAAETAERNAKEIGRAAPTTTIHAVSSDQRQKKGGARQSTNARPSQCYRCGGKHLADKCRFKDSECHHCGKMGHIAKACRSKRRGSNTQQQPLPQTKSSHRTHHVDADPDDVAAYDEQLFNIPTRRSAPPLTARLKVNQADLEMEVDTGASASLISFDTYTALWHKGQRPKLTPSSRTLRTYTGEQLEIKGSLMVDVVCGSQNARLPLLVVAGKGPSLLGRDWLLSIRLDWQGLHRLQPAPPTESLHVVLDKHLAVFTNELGRMKGVKATLYLKSDAQPRFCKPRSVPFALHDKVDKELERRSWRH